MTVPNQLCAALLHKWVALKGKIWMHVDNDVKGFGRMTECMSSNISSLSLSKEMQYTLYTEARERISTFQMGSRTKGSDRGY